MINHLSIRNFAIIENLQLDIKTGLNILTGETGSGKSIIFTALSLALGSRADTSMVRTGADKAIIQMSCDHLNEEYIITREISSSGKSLCKINDDLVTLSQLQEFTSQIASLHGQYDNQYLLNPASHIHLIDMYEKKTIEACKTKVSDYFKEYVSTYKVIQEIKNKSAEQNALIEQLKFELNEIRSANLLPNELEELKNKLVEETNKETIFKGFNNIYDFCTAESSSINTILNTILHEMKDLKKYTKDANYIEDDFLDVKYRLEDIINNVRLKASSATYNQKEIDRIEDRLLVINDLSRKYGNTTDDIIEYAEKIEKKLKDLSNINKDLSSKEIELERYGELLKTETSRLSFLRKTSASSLEEEISRELKSLNLQDTIIKINIEKKDKYTANGIDKIEMLISTNKGESLKPLAKIASGGEISRIMLAFKNVIGKYDKVETLIFDEIDSGISGIAATLVAKKLQEIAWKHQVISITHLPQIAAAGNHNYKISKHTENNETFTTITPLSDKDKTLEIARLLSGTEVTDISVQNATELIKTFK
ncbi:MAG: DNA repair protein RecN [Anaerovoracaceae bacterium]